MNGIHLTNSTILGPGNANLERLSTIVTVTKFLLFLWPRQMDPWRNAASMGTGKYDSFDLVDGHISRLVSFLMYINTHAMRWGMGVGAPYGTST